MKSGQFPSPLTLLQFYSILHSKCYQCESLPFLISSVLHALQPYHNFFSSQDVSQVLQPSNSISSPQINQWYECYNLYLQCLLIKSTSIKRYTTLKLYFLLSNHHVTSVTSLIFCHFNIFTSGTSVTTLIFCVFSSYQPVLQPSFSTSPHQINKFYECYKQLFIKFDIKLPIFHFQRHVV